jgi:hypothetical protein
MQPMETDMRIPLGAALILAATLSAVAAIPAGAEEMGSTTHVYKKAKPKKLHLPKLNLDALDSMTTAPGGRLEALHGPRRQIHAQLRRRHLQAARLTTPGGRLSAAGSASFASLIRASYNP